MRARSAVNHAAGRSEGVIPTASFATRSVATFFPPGIAKGVESYSGRGTEKRSGQAEPKAAFAAGLALANGPGLAN